MKTRKFILLVFILFLIPRLSFADISNTVNADTPSKYFDCTAYNAGNYKAYQYLGKGLSGNLSSVSIKINNLGTVYYGKFVGMRIYESDEYLNDYNSIFSSNLVWSQGETFLDFIRISNYDGIVTFSDPVIGSQYNFNPEKHYYLFPVYMSSDAGGLCQASYIYGSADSNSYPNGEYVSDPYIKDIYFDLKGLSYSTTTPTGSSNVLFIPGFEASRLYENKTVAGVSVEDQLWEPQSNLDPVHLYMDENGISLNPNIFTRDIIDETNVPISTGLAGQNIYKSFIVNMNSLVGDGTIVAWQSYPYDWRQGVQDIVDNGTIHENGRYTLTQALQSLITASKSGKVTIIAHSNGGLIAKALLKKLTDDKAAGRNNLIDKIDTVILVASPQWGTPAAIPALLHGYDQQQLYGLILDKSVARELGRNAPGAFGLLPSAEYFNHINTPVISFLPNYFDTYISKDITTYGQSINTYSGLNSFILGSDGRVNPLIQDILKPIVLKNNLLSQATSLHTGIDNITIPSAIRLIQIAGWGLDTIAGFQYTSIKPCKSITQEGCTGSYVLDEKPVFTFDGDKTVISPSAIAMDGENYWVNLLEHNRQLIISLRRNRQHKDILEVNSLENLLSSIIKKQSPVLDLVLTNTKPVDNSNRLRLSVHSPITIEATDSYGAFTGKVCFQTLSSCYLREDIPNSGYYEFGEGKYINMVEDGAKNIKLKGTGTGTFTFNADEYSGESLIASTTFKDVPVNPNTIVTLEVQNTLGSLSSMHVDVNGDGMVDVNLVPKLNEVVVFPKYRFDGFLQPINDTGQQSGQVLSVFKAGSTIPVKIQLKDWSGNIIQASSSPVLLAPQKGSAMSMSVDESVYSDVATTGSNFKWDSVSQQYVYNWSTKGIASGYWYKISVKLDDGNIYSVTIGLK